MSIDTFAFKGQEVTPRVVVKTIVRKYPEGGAAKWLRVFESVVAERPDLRRLIVQQAFAATLMSLSATDPAEPLNRLHPYNFARASKKKSLSEGQRPG